VAALSLKLDHWIIVATSRLELDWAADTTGKLLDTNRFFRNLIAGVTTARYFTEK
jgi:hypothetical protein